MIDTSVTYVSAQINVNVFKIDATAIKIGTTTAGNVPNTNNKMITAPTPPINASVNTLGPPDSDPCESYNASRPVTCASTPTGTARFNAARILSNPASELKLGLPGG